MAQIDKKTIEKVAKAARLNLTEKEAEKYSKDLAEILDAFKTLDRAKTGGISPAFQPLEMKNVLREDVVEESLKQGEALANSKKNMEHGFFKGPRAV